MALPDQEEIFISESQQSIRGMDRISNFRSSQP